MENFDAVGRNVVAAAEESYALRPDSGSFVVDLHLVTAASVACDGDSAFTPGMRHVFSRLENEPTSPLNCCGDKSEDHGHAVPHCQALSQAACCAKPLSQFAHQCADDIRAI